MVKPPAPPMGEVGATDAGDSFTGTADGLDVQRLALFMGSSGQHAASIERRQAFYSGHVQGVGFRETTRRLAAGLDVAGFVRNLDDGRVEMIAEGTPAELGRFMAAIAERMEGRIRQLAVDARPGTGEFVGFVIRQ